MRQRGFSLVELMIVVAIMGVLAAIGIPGFTTMIDSNRSKSAAESITSGLRLARAEAIARNAPIRFQLVSTLDSGCALSTTSAFWVVTQTNQSTGGYTYGLPQGHCDADAAVPANTCDAGTCGDHPYIAYKSPGNSFNNVQITANSAPDPVSGVVTPTPAVTFGPLGQVLPNLEGTSSLGTVAVAVPSNADAKTWQVRVMPGSGAIKFCDPTLTAGSPLACS